jgi:hypothetical protein
LPLKLPIKAKGEERDQVKGSCSLEQSNKISNFFKQKKSQPKSHRFIYGYSCCKGGRSSWTYFDTDFFGMGEKVQWTGTLLGGGDIFQVQPQAEHQQLGENLSNIT